MMIRYDPDGTCNLQGKPGIEKERIYAALQTEM